MKQLSFLLICFVFPVYSFCEDIYTQKEKELVRDNVIMLSVAINDFNQDGYGHLECKYNVDKYIRPLESSFQKNYKKVSFVYSSDKEQKTSSQVKDLLNNWKKMALEDNPDRSLAILYLSSHGNKDSLDYYFITEDSAISGTEISNYVKYLADSGVIVLVFIDTCHGDALYEKHFKDFSCKHRLGGVAFFAASAENNSAYMVNKKSLFTESLYYCLSGQDVSSIAKEGVLVSSLKYFIENRIATISKILGYKNQNPKAHDELIGGPFVILKKCSDPPYHLRFAHFNPFAKVPDLSQFIRFAKSNARAKTYSTILHSVEIASLLTAATSIGIIFNQQSKINDLDNRGLDSNPNRKTARTACYTFYGSTTVFALAYGLQVANIHHQFKKKHIVDTFESIEKGFKDNYVSSISLGPIVGSNCLGIGLTYNF